MSTEPQAKEAVEPLDDVALVEKLVAAYDRLRSQIARTIVGQEAVVEELLIAMFCNGHCILEGVPGLAKTLMISSIAQLLSLTFRRIQFTPDLMPSDLTGVNLLAGPGTFTFRQILAMRPSGPMSTVVRSTPIYLRPYMLFSTQTP